MRKPPVGAAVRTHTTFIKFAVLYGHSSWLPKAVIVVTSRILIMDHHNKCNEEVSNIARITRCDTETRSKQMLLEKWHQ